MKTFVGEEEALADPEAFFEANARYDPRNSEAYSIVFRGYGFTSGDTRDLARKFYRAVERHRRNLKATKRRER